ncbi:MAG: transcription antitermination factor NusB [Dysgonamonadaceae bacterium]|jgi:N utilization substance protein B|nr:transcription antitermination factor NusB [Dysgonamonadaceae bacterium]
MINRVLIRIKILQIVYAHYQKSAMPFNNAENELNRSLQTAYNLYHYLLLLIGILTDLEQKRIDSLQYKFLFSEEDRNPNLRLANNRFAEELRTNEALEKFANQYGRLWDDDDRTFLQNLRKEILQSNIYKDYLQQKDNYESDRKFWCNIFRDIILNSDSLIESLEEKNIYWQDDLETIGSFALKTIKRIEEGNPQQALFPMFRDDDDRRFALSLLYKTIHEKEENSELINQQIQNWDLERIASIDLYIMQMALAEIKNYPEIPINVSLNEYIELARYYSTPKSALFINGVLDKIVTALQKEGKLFKN